MSQYFNWCLSSRNFYPIASRQRICKQAWSAFDRRSSVLLLGPRSSVPWVEMQRLQEYIWQPGEVPWPLRKNPQDLSQALLLWPLVCWRRYLLPPCGWLRCSLGDSAEHTRGTVIYCGTLGHGGAPPSDGAPDTAVVLGFIAWQHLRSIALLFISVWVVIDNALLDGSMGVFHHHHPDICMLLAFCTRYISNHMRITS